MGYIQIGSIYGKRLNLDNLDKERKEAEETAANENPVSKNILSIITKLQKNICAIKEINRISKEKYNKILF